MRTVQEIYAEYRIMPSLQLHQLRVAAIGKLICDHFSEPLDSHSIILACLFHDMGNIIKSDLKTFPEFIEPEGYDYWKSVKDDYVMKYGSNEHHANIEIGKEIGLPSRVIELMDGVGFSKLERTRDIHSFEQKIVEYADQRVGPNGILSMNERLKEARTRYVGRDTNNDIPESHDSYETLLRAAQEVEKQLFSRADIKSIDICDEAVASSIEELRNYSVA